MFFHISQHPPSAGFHGAGVLSVPKEELSVMDPFVMKHRSLSVRSMLISFPSLSVATIFLAAFFSSVISNSTFVTVTP